jgi:hypothetical protein
VLGAVREEGADGDPQLVQWVGESGVECGGQPSSQGLEAQSMVAYHSPSFEPKRPLSRLWLAPSSRLSVRSETPS